MEGIGSLKEVVYFLIYLSLAATCSTSSATQSSMDESPKIGAASSPQIPVGKKHFVLIHGSGHGAWSWYKVATLLKSSGHNVTALDLGASGINPIQVQQLPSFSDYVEPLTKLMVSLPPKERVILVSHSMTGATIAVFMEKFPEKIAAAVYVNAFMSGPSLNYSTILAEVKSELHSCTSNPS